MADFVAVIRRAVDGLSDNTPEMRVKVYDRARSAVQRQLESMKPRPPETMLQRQLEKLEAAIRDIEAEHAEALPSLEEPPIEAAAEPHYEAEPEPVAEEAPVAEPAPVEAAPVVHHEPEPEPEPAVQPTAEETWNESDDWQPEAPAPAVAAAAPEPVVYEEPAHPEYPAAEAYAPVTYEPAPEPAHAEFAQERPASIGYSIDEVHHQMAEVPPEVASAIPSEHFIEETHHEPLHADGAAHFDEVWAEPAAPAADDHARAELAWPAPAEEAAAAHVDDTFPIDSLVQAAPVKMPEADERFAWDATAFDDLPPVAPAGTAKPTPAGDFDDVDLFADVHGGPAPAPAAKAAPAANDGWSELKELSGYDKFAEEVDLGPEAPADVDQLMASKLQGRSYRMEPKRRRFGLVGILVTVAVVAVVAGAGYAAWLNRASLNDMVAGLVSSATKNATPVQKASTTAPASTPATTPAKTDTASAQPTPAKPATANTATPENDGSTVNNKFTQRLLANGSEVDPGQPPASGTPQPPEGKSIAQQNVAAAASQPATPPAVTAPAAPPAAATTTPAPAPTAASTDAVPTPTAPPASAQVAATPATPAATDAAPTTPSTPPPVAQTATVGTPEKMFLYEERLGQTSPTAIEGSVTWTTVEDKGDDGRPSPTIQGSINVPERGMTAMITLKRNTDPSLPASHLIELVFSLPPNFEGGAIDSVQRVAMKATEQDRGDPLIAVPAKITDDFHMVALNDFPDARKTNLELLRTRDWIDIPITYRNGRRALLTMQKGKTGGDAFNKVIGEWAALGGDTAAAQ